MSEQPLPNKSPTLKWWIGGIAGGILLLSCTCCGCGGIFVGLPAWQRTREAAKATQEKQNEQKADMTLAAYLAQRPEKPAKITVIGKLNNYYNYAYRNSVTTHYSVSLRSDSPFKSGSAWVLKDSDAGRRLFDALKDGREYRMTLEIVLQGPDGLPTPPDREEMAIVRVLN
jgi:hypothetical protein